MKEEKQSKAEESKVKPLKNARQLRREKDTEIRDAENKKTKVSQNVSDFMPD